MATTWSADAWGDNSWASNQNTIDVNGISASFDLGSPVAYPNKGFGGLAWGQGQWSDLPNASAQISGFSLTTNQGQAVYTPLSGWDAYEYGSGSWGDIPNATAIPTGIEASFNIGQVTQESSTGWGRATWSSSIWNGYGTVLLSGVSANFDVGNVTIDGQIISGWGGSAWGNTGWGAYGDVLLSGISLSSNLGSVSIDNQINIGWGSDTYGYETWGASGLIVTPTGIEATFTIGTLGSAADANTGELTGEAMTIAQGDAEGYIDFREIVSGIPMTMTLQYSEVVINAVGFGMTMQEGDEVADANTIAEVSSTVPSYYGFGQWGAGVYGDQPIETLAMSMLEGSADAEPDAMLTGIQMSANIGTLSLTGDANTGTLTGIEWGQQTWGESSWGNGTYFDATGYAQAATITLNSVIATPNTIASITGQLMTMQEGDESTTANARVIPTGNALTTATGTVYNLIWNEVNTGTTSVWTEVDTAA
jgi:hypothetical protein